MQQNDSGHLQQLFHKIIRFQDKNALKEFFGFHSGRLVRFAHLYAETEQEAEEIVSGVLDKLLMKKEYRLTMESIEGYLFYTVKVAALKHVQNKEYPNNRFREHPVMMEELQ